MDDKAGKFRAGGRGVRALELAGIPRAGGKSRDGGVIVRRERSVPDFEQGDVAGRRHAAPRD